MRQLFFAVKDGKGWEPVSFDEAWEKNQKGAAMYFTVQEFHGDKRVKSELKTIHYIAADFDNITERELRARLEDFPRETMMVQTGKGYHVWWKIKPIEVDDYEKWSEKYKTFVEETLVPIGADPNAKDVCRVLRYPTSIYWQNEKILRQCNLISDNENEYTWGQIEALFPRLKPVLTHENAPRFKNNLSPRGVLRPNNKNDLKGKYDRFWAWANNLPSRACLEHLSGSGYVNGEVYEFKKQGEITRIIINGKPSNAWLDKNGFIGSTQRAGPAIANWLSYFGHNWKQIAEILKKEFGYENPA
jgi:hypothetical protein